MELINATSMVADYNMGMEPSGRELLVVVIKGTFRLPLSGEPMGRFSLADEQLPLVMADTFSGEPGFSAPVYETDFAPRKHACDILLLGSAHAPQGRPSSGVAVGIRIGRWEKRFAVLGPRHWAWSAGRARASEPAMFVQQPISYGVAFGGTDLQHDDPTQHAAFMANPVGCGFHKHLRRDWVEGSALPATEELGQPVLDPTGDYRPMAFGPIGRAWSARACFAGTYDDVWLEDYFPFLPPDFDERYYQAAPADQQVPLDHFHRGPVEVQLANLTPQGIVQFAIPSLEIPVSIFPKREQHERHTAHMDTVVIEPDAGRFTLTWRVARPLKKNMLEIAQVVVGKKGRQWWQQRERVAIVDPAQLSEASHAAAVESEGS